MTLSLLHRLSGATDPSESAWESFHEASKTSPHDHPPSSQEVRRRMTQMTPSFGYEGYPAHPLPPAPKLEAAFSEVVLGRQTARDIGPCRLTDEQLAALLFYSVGETRDETASGFPRPFRVTPSGGAMYPLELYIHANRAERLESGVHHYHPGRHVLRRLIEGDQTRRLSAGFVQHTLPLECGVLVFITGVFERSTFKYGERGYRFTLLEAGHVAQNLVLTASALGLRAVTVGGFFDRDVDELLGLDGLEQSTLYVVAIGAPTGRDWLGI